MAVASALQQTPRPSLKKELPKCRLIRFSALIYKHQREAFPSGVYRRLSVPSDSVQRGGERLSRPDGPQSVSKSPTLTI